MASLIEDLVYILKEETGCYNLLLEMADNKKEVIIKGDLPGLQGITKKEQELAGLLLRLERERVATIKDICLVTNKASENITVSELITLLEGQEKVKDRLSVLVDKLSETVQKLQMANEQNKQLLNQSLEFIEFTMNAIQTGKEPVSTNHYKSRGQSYNSSSSNNFFDARQ